MALHKISTVNRRGFTLIEMLIVIGILTSVASLAMFIDLNSYRGDAFRAEKNTITTLLQKARADALNNIDQTAHGVAFSPIDHPNTYVLFEGVSYAASDPQSRDVFTASYAAQLGTTSPSEVVFTQLSGTASYDGDITVLDTQRGLSSTITINHEGLID